MNGKKAKRLRREAGYFKKTDTSEMMRIRHRSKGTNQVILDPASPKAKYKAAKKAA